MCLVNTMELICKRRENNIFSLYPLVPNKLAFKLETQSVSPPRGSLATCNICRRRLQYLRSPLVLFFNSQRRAPRNVINWPRQQQWGQRRARSRLHFGKGGESKSGGWRIWPLQWNYGHIRRRALFVCILNQTTSILNELHF
jgi:hypothetical protein